MIQSGGQPLFGIDLGELRHAKLKGLALRFAFGASISIVAGIVGLVGGLRLGGVFLAAPAILPATLTLIERDQGRRQAELEVSGSVMGGVALTAFAVVSAVLLGAAPWWLALLGALVAWIAVAVLLYLIRAFARPAWRREVHGIAAKAEVRS